MQKTEMPYRAFKGRLYCNIVQKVAVLFLGCSTKINTLKKRGVNSWFIAEVERIGGIGGIGDLKGIQSPALKI